MSFEVQFEKNAASKKVDDEYLSEGQAAYRSCSIYALEWFTALIENTDVGEEEGIFEVLNGRIKDVIEGFCRWTVFSVSIYRKEENSRRSYQLS